MNSCNVASYGLNDRSMEVSRVLQALEFNYAELSDQDGWCFVAQLVRYFDQVVEVYLFKSTSWHF